MPKFKWAIFFFIVFLPACSKASAPAGNLAMYLTDLPVNMEKVLVAISAIDVHETGGASFTVFSGERQYDLLLLKDNPVLLFDTPIEEGKYTQISMQVSAGQIQVAGVLYPLTVPSSEVKINCNFSVAAGGSTQVTLDFDAENSLQVNSNPENNNYILRPVIVVKNITY